MFAFNFSCNNDWRSEMEPANILQSLGLSILRVLHVDFAGPDGNGEAKLLGKLHQGGLQESPVLSGLAGRGGLLPLGGGALLLAPLLRRRADPPAEGHPGGGLPRASADGVPGKAFGPVQWRRRLQLLAGEAPIFL